MSCPAFSPSHLRLALAAALLAQAQPLPAADSAPRSHLALRAEAQTAYQRKDFPAALRATAAALALRPDSPRYLYNLAALSALTHDGPGAVTYLRRLAALGVSLPVERDPDFASLQGTAPFRQALALLAANRAPRGEAEILAELPGRTGIIEGLAFRPRTGDLFLSDVRHRCIWRRDRTGQVTRFTAEDEELLGLFGLALDEPRGSLWAAMSAVPEMSGYSPELKGAAALVEFNLLNSEIRRIVHVPDEGRDHGLGDLVVAPDGTVYASDAKSPIIWKLAPGAEDFEILVDSPDLVSPQGLVLWRQELIVADYANGLFAVDLATGRLRAFAPPADATLLGLDGLVATADGLVATQNGVEPQRVIRLGFSPGMETVTAVTVLAAGLPNLTDLTLLTIVDGRPTLVAGAGWDSADPAKPGETRPHTVRIFQANSP